MDVQSMSDEEVRARLKSFNQDVPPITETTRGTLKKRLTKLMAGGGSKATVKAPSIPRSDSPSGRRTRQTPPVGATAATRPGPSPASRTVPSSGSPRKGERSGAAFSSDEEEEDIYVERIRRPQGQDTTTGSPLRGNLNGRLLSSGMRSTVGATDSSGPGTPSPLSGFGRFFRLPGTIRTPTTSTPGDRDGARGLGDSFGAMTPIRDSNIDALRRRPLGRPPLSSFDNTDAAVVPKAKSSGFFDRFAADPIHLTPQPALSKERFTRHSPPRPRPLQFLGRSRSEDGGWASRYISWIIVLAAILFFTLVGLMYARMKLDSSDLDSRIVRYQLEGGSEADVLYQKKDFEAGRISARENGRYYTEEDTLLALNIASALSKELSRLKGDAICNDKEKYSMTIPEARTFALHTVPDTKTTDFANAVDLIVANPHWGIKPLDANRKPVTAMTDVKVLESEFATKDLACRWKEALASMLFKILLTVAGVLLVMGLAWILRKYFQHRTRREEAVFHMVNKIVGVVQKNYEQSLKDVRVKPYLAISHIRETLVPHGRQRKELMSVFDDAVKYINANESRLKTDVETMDGEEFEVWTWLHNQIPMQQPDSTEPVCFLDAPSTSHASVNTTGNGQSTNNLSTAKARIWSGGANVKTLLPEQLAAATSCLKVRGMFNPKTENQADPTWTDEIEDAILEKCHGVARILDMQVERLSEEGIVYIKLASNEDARNAYLGMHGQYFDGSLVNVKFLKLDRYHQRFPDAMHKKAPLQRRV